MKNTDKFKAMLRIAGIIALAAVIGFSFTACGGDDDTGGTSGGCDATCLAIGATGPGDGIIIYHKHSGFTVTGAGSFTAYYLEAALNNQVTYGVTWSSTDVNVTGANGTAIGTGKANTAAIITAHSGDTASNNAAKAAVGCTEGGKNDWFLPSKDELNEMYKASNHLGISSGDFWSSSQDIGGYSAWSQNFDFGYQDCYFKSGSTGYHGNANDVRAVRAF